MNGFVEIILAALVAAPAHAASPAATAAVGETCSVLQLDWQRLDHEITMREIQGITDDSVPRATMRAVRDSNALLQGEMTLQLMRDYHCPLPKRALNMRDDPASPSSGSAP